MYCVIIFGEAGNSNGTVTFKEINNEIGQIFKSIPAD